VPPLGKIFLSSPRTSSNLDIIQPVGLGKVSCPSVVTLFLHGKDLSWKFKSYSNWLPISPFFEGEMGARKHHFKINVFFSPDKSNLFSTKFFHFYKKNVDEVVRFGWNSVWIWWKSVFCSKRWTNVEMQCFTKF